MDSSARSPESCLKSFKSVSIIGMKKPVTRRLRLSPLHASFTTKESENASAVPVFVLVLARAASSSRHASWTEPQYNSNNSDDDNYSDSDDEDPQDDEDRSLNMLVHENPSEDTLVSIMADGFAVKRKKAIDVDPLRHVAVEEASRQTPADTVSAPLPRAPALAQSEHERHAVPVETRNPPHITEDPVAFLRPVSRLGRNKTLRIPPEESSTVGRDESNDLVVHDPFVAETHAIVNATDDGTVLLHSVENEFTEIPVYVNGKKVEPDEPVVLENRDTVTLGTWGHGSKWIYLEKADYVAGPPA